MAKKTIYGIPNIRKVFREIKMIKLGNKRFRPNHHGSCPGKEAGVAHGQHERRADEGKNYILYFTANAFPTKRLMKRNK